MGKGLASTRARRNDSLKQVRNFKERENVSLSPHLVDLRDGVLAEGRHVTTRENRVVQARVVRQTLGKERLAWKEKGRGRGERERRGRGGRGGEEERERRETAVDPSNGLGEVCEAMYMRALLGLGMKPCMLHLPYTYESKI
jgi:hypothetical protein